MHASDRHSRRLSRWRPSTGTGTGTGTGTRTGAALPKAVLAASILALSACSDTGGTAPGAVSEGEARALEEAAEMLEERRLPDGVVPEPDAPAALGPAQGEIQE